MVRNYADTMHCGTETKRFIMEECVEEFLKHHPEMKEMNITQGFMLDKIAKYYLGIK